MIDVSDYIKLILKKRKISNRELCRRINEIEKRLGDKRTSPQNITNYLNGSHTITQKWLVKVECALDLPIGTLINKVKSPVGKESIKELIKKVRGI